MKRFMASILVAILGTNVWAVGSGGFANQVVGTRALGMGNAFSAVADDSSAVFFNPAGLTQIERGEVSFGAAPHFPSSEYENAGATTKMDNFTPVVPNFYSALRLGSGPVTVGFGMFSPYGLKSLWPTDGSFEYQTTESNLTIPQISPVVAYKMSDKISFGAGVVFARGYATLKSALPVDLINQNDPFYGPPANAPDGEQIMEGDGHGFGVNTGVLFQPTKNHAFALTYRSDIKIDLKGTVTLKGLSNEMAVGYGGQEYSTDVKSSITLPPSVTLGYAFKIADWTCAVDGEWVGFSSYRSTQLDFPDTSLIEDKETRHEYKDAWSVSTGINYAWNKLWQSRAGYSYYPAVATQANWDPSVPDSATNGFHVGGSWTGAPVMVDLSYSYFLYNDITINNEVGSPFTSVNGNYKTSAQVVSANVTYRF